MEQQCDYRNNKFKQIMARIINERIVCLMGTLEVSELRYELVKLFKHKCLFTSLRVARETVPEGLYAYDIRYDDAGVGIPCQIKEFVLVNHYGTIITDYKIKKAKEGVPIDENDLMFLQGDYTLEAYYGEKARTKRMV